jgi:hypothetical protein
VLRATAAITKASGKSDESEPRFPFSAVSGEDVGTVHTVTEDVICMSRSLLSEPTENAAVCQDVQG